MHERDVDFRVAIVTVSTSRYEKYGRVRGVEEIGEFDESGKLIYETFRDRTVHYVLVPDSVVEIRRAVLESLEIADVCIVTGGTGLSPSDVTVEAVEPLFTKKIDGFGETFRRLSYDEIGFSALLSRATAGLVEDKVVFCLPGSKKAVRLGVEIISGVLKHVLTHARGMA